MDNKEQTRVRNQGTIVVNPKDGVERINAIRQIVEGAGYMKIDGQLVDSFTASGIIQLYDKLNDVCKEKYRNCNVSKMAAILWKMVK